MEGNDEPRRPFIGTQTQIWNKASELFVEPALKFEDCAESNLTNYMHNWAQS